jgi:hypothetical protein
MGKTCRQGRPDGHTVLTARLSWVDSRCRHPTNRTSSPASDCLDTRQAMDEICNTLLAVCLPDRTVNRRALSQLWTRQDLRTIPWQRGAARTAHPKSGDEPLGSRITQDPTPRKS